MRIVCRFVALVLIAGAGIACAAEPVPPQKEYEPASGPGRVVVVVSGQTGMLNYASYAKDISAQGFYTVLVDGNDFWLKGGRGEARSFSTTSSHAQQSPHALPGKAGVIGFSLGGGSSLAYATRIPDLVFAAVTYYPLTSFVKDPNALVSTVKVPTLILAGGRETYKNFCLIETARSLAIATKESNSKLLEVVEFPEAERGFILHSAWRSDDAADAFRRTLSHLRQYSAEA